jgi:5'-deoxynucleotidase YfbR-like HD superfamily hydrolase
MTIESLKELAERPTADLRLRLPPELRTMSIVPRWSIVHTQIKDTVANHSFYVAFYAREVALLIDWDGDLGDLMYRALVHDAEEAISGDIVGPVKREIIDNERANAYLRGQLLERMPWVVSDLDDLEVDWPAESAEAWRIIKFADRLDALIFLMTERRLGNGVVAPHLPLAMSKLELSWRLLPADRELLDELWCTVVLPAIQAHETNGGAGLAL